MKRVIYLLLLIGLPLFLMGAGGVKSGYDAVRRSGDTMTGNLETPGLTVGPGVATLSDAYMTHLDCVGAAHITGTLFVPQINLDNVGSASHSLGRWLFGAPTSADDGFNILQSFGPASISVLTLAGVDVTGALATATNFTAVASGASTVLYKPVVLASITATAEGGTTALAHGLTRSKIRSCDVLVHASSSTVGPECVYAAELQFSVLLGDSSIIVKLHDSNSGSLLSKQFYATIWYEP